MAVLFVNAKVSKYLGLGQKFDKKDKRQKLHDL